MNSKTAQKPTSPRQRGASCESTSAQGARDRVNLNATLNDPTACKEMGVGGGHLPCHSTLRLSFKGRPTKAQEIRSQVPVSFLWASERDKHLQVSSLILHQLHCRPHLTQAVRDTISLRTRYWYSSSFSLFSLPPFSVFYLLSPQKNSIRHTVGP